MRVSIYDLRVWHRTLLPIFGTKRFCSRDVKPYLGNTTSKKIGTILRLMWYNGFADRHGIDKMNVRIYSLRTDV